VTVASSQPMAGNEPERTGINVGELRAARLIGALECELKRSLGLTSPHEAQHLCANSENIESALKQQVPAVAKQRGEDSSRLLQALHEMREENALLQQQNVELARHAAEMQQGPRISNEGTCLQWHADGLVTLVPAHRVGQTAKGALQLPMPCLSESSAELAAQQREAGPGAAADQHEAAGARGADASCASEAVFIRQALAHLCESGAAVVSEASRLREQHETSMKQAALAQDDLVRVLRRGRDLQEELNRLQDAANCALRQDPEPSMANSNAPGNLPAGAECEESAKLLVSCQDVGKQLAELLASAQATQAESGSLVASGRAGTTVTSSVNVASSSSASVPGAAGASVDLVQHLEGALAALKVGQEDADRCTVNGTSPAHLLLAQLNACHEIRREAYSAKAAEGEVTMQTELRAALAEIGEYRKQQPTAVNKPVSARDTDLSWREELATAQLREAALRVEVEDTRRELAEYRWDMLMYEGSHGAVQIEAAPLASVVRTAMDSTGLVLPVPRLAATERAVSVGSVRPNTGRGIGASVAEAEIAARLAKVKDQVRFMEEEVAASAATEVELRSEVMLAQSEMRSAHQQDAAVAELQARLDSATEEEMQCCNIATEARALLLSARSEVTELLEERVSMMAEVMRFKGELDLARSHEAATQARLDFVSSEEASAANMTAAMLRSEVSIAYLEATQVETRCRAEVQIARDELSSAKQASADIVLCSPKPALCSPKPVLCSPKPALYSPKPEAATICPTPPKTPPEKVVSTATALRPVLRSEAAARAPSPDRLRAPSPDRSQPVVAHEISLSRTPPQGGSSFTPPRTAPRAELWQAEIRPDFRGTSASRGTSSDSLSARGASITSPLLAFSAAGQVAREALPPQRARSANSPPRLTPPLLPGGLPVVLPPAMWRTASPAEQAAPAQQIPLVSQSARRAAKKSGAPPPSLTPPLSRQVPFAPWGLAPTPPGMVGAPGTSVAAAPLPSQVVAAGGGMTAAVPMVPKVIRAAGPPGTESPGRLAQAVTSPRRRVLSPALPQQAAMMTSSVRSTYGVPGAGASGAAPVDAGNSLGSTAASLSNSVATVEAPGSVTDASAPAPVSATGVQHWAAPGAAPLPATSGATLPSPLSAPQSVALIKRMELSSQCSASTDSTAATSGASLAQWMHSSSASSAASPAQTFAATPPDAEEAPPRSAPAFAAAAETRPAHGSA